MSELIDSAKKPAILILGAPGSGKGTQGAVLAQIPRFYHYSSGDVFRQLDTRTELGRKFVEYSKQGELVPDELTIQLWASHMRDLVRSHRYKPDIDILVLDGIPRNQDQAKMLEDHVEIHQVFHLSCPNRDELARRLRKRALKEQRLDDASEVVFNDENYLWILNGSTGEEVFRAPNKSRTFTTSESSPTTDHSFSTRPSSHDKEWSVPLP
mgnify:CR=1 FL=1